MSYENGSEENEIWRVQSADGDMLSMTLDQLDEAFNAGTIGGQTRVLPPGATAWTTLADAAGLDDAAPAPAPARAPVPAMYEANSLAPMAVDPSPASQMGLHMVPSAAALPDLDLMDDAALKPKKGRIFAFVGIAAVVLGGHGFAASRIAPPMTASAANAMQAEQALKAAAAAPQGPSEEDLAASKRLQQLTDEQRQKLLDADKAREAAAAAKRKEKESHAAPAHRSGPTPKSGEVFHKGGSKYDPLNGAL